MTPQGAKRVLFVAGETSGDAQASRLAEAMLRRCPELVLYGVGGAAMRHAGVDTIIDCDELSIMGFSEVASGLGRALRHYRRLAAELRSPSRPGLIVLVDFPDFNLPLARVARRAGVPVLYYVSPQVWAWRRRRIAKIASRVDRMIVLFPFEERLYRDRGVDAHYVGNPLAADVVATRSGEDTRERYGIAGDRPLIALLPGSRTKEVTQVLPLMLESARLLGGGVAFVIAGVAGLGQTLYSRLVAESGIDVSVVCDDTYNLLAACDAVAVTSGTATVECALLGCPMVVVYKMSRVSYAIARLLVRVSHIAMPNIILGDRVVPELVQAEATPKRLAEELQDFLDSRAERDRVVERLAEVRRVLVRRGAAERAAELAVELLV